MQQGIPPIWAPPSIATNRRTRGQAEQRCRQGTPEETLLQMIQIGATTLRVAAPTVRLPHQQSLGFPESPCSLLVVISDRSRESLPGRRLFLRQLLLHTRRKLGKHNKVAVTVHTLKYNPSVPETWEQLQRRLARESVSSVCRIDRKKQSKRPTTREAGALLTTSPAATFRLVCIFKMTACGSTRCVPLRKRHKWGK